MNTVYLAGQKRCACPEYAEMLFVAWEGNTSDIEKGQQYMAAQTMPTEHEVSNLDRREEVEASLLMKRMADGQRMDRFQGPRSNVVAGDGVHTVVQGTCAGTAVGHGKRSSATLVETRSGMTEQSENRSSQEVHTSGPHLVLG